MVDNCILEIKRDITEIKEDLAVVKTDVTWMKRLFTIVLVAIAGFLGIDVSNII